MGRRSAPQDRAANAEDYDHIAYVEDGGDDGEPVSGTQRTYARSNVSPVKEKPNTGRSRKNSIQRERSPVDQVYFDSSDATEAPRTPRRATKMASKGKKTKSQPVVVPDMPAKRPAARTARTTPAPSSRASDDSSSYYGVPQPRTITSSSSRPQARPRPGSYHGQSPRQQRPPLSTSAYYQQPPPPSHLPMPSFPPPSWSTAVQAPIAPLPGHDFYQRDLAHRFRPQSAMGFSPSSSPLDHEPAVGNTLTRRPSTTRKAHKEHEDRKRMPPPARPKSARPSERGGERIVLRAQQPGARKSVGFEDARKPIGFEDDDLSGDGSLYEPVTRHASIEYGSMALPGRSHRQSYILDSAYDDESDFVTASPPRSRRNSYIQYEDKLRHATQYQDNVQGPGASLTAAALRHVKNGSSSRSTRSSASRDESDYKTRTTRSSSGSDELTIRVPTGAIIEVGGTKIHCKDGGDISLPRGGTSRGGSDRATSYGDERRSRSDRSTTTRRHASSQAPTYRHPLPQYPYRPPPPLAAPMGYQNYNIPPPPSYPTTTFYDPHTGDPYV
ncbi:hypothetical protein GGR56DRAFT_108809 [Xylariaceae sp. FL0804]|nr:hypothetical protein GGR56DRAFT_108809 [Xylariaceae sp. FL0804]